MKTLTLLILLVAVATCEDIPEEGNKVVRKRGLLPYPGVAFTPVATLGYPALSTHPYPAFTTIAYPGYGLRYPFAPAFPGYYPGFTIYGK